jgi:tetratricopeptide (TPR) repeat protein
MRVSVARGLVTTAFLFNLFAIVSAGTEDPYLGAMARGNALLVRNQFEDALKEFKAASAARNKTSVEAHLAMARAYQGLGAYKNALDSATDALRLAADDKKFEAFSRNTRGIALIALAGNDSKDKRLKEAESEFRAVLALGNAVPLARYNLGLALLKQVRDDEGVQELTTFISEKRTGPEVQNATQYVQNPRRVRDRMLWPQIFDNPQRIGRVYNPPGLPTYVIVDHEGISRGTRTGWGPDIENWLRSELAKYVNAAAKSITP